ncbi:MAG: glycosyltransferase [Clostridiaceae bacterium]
MRKLLSKILLSVILVTTLAPSIKVYALEEPNDIRVCSCETSDLLNKKERMLWGEHIFWTRNYIVSKLSSLDDKDKVLERLLKNQEDIGNSFIEFYGEEVGENITKLLTEHITIADKVVDAAKNGNNDELKKYNEQWHKNADEIVDYLSKINPNYDKNTLKELFYKHLSLLTDAVVARLGKNYDDEISAFDQGEEHIFILSDVISSGIAKQFADKFR